VTPPFDQSAWSTCESTSCDEFNIPPTEEVSCIPLTVCSSHNRQLGYSTAVTTDSQEIQPQSQLAVRRFSCSPTDSAARQLQRRSNRSPNLQSEDSATVQQTVRDSAAVNCSPNL